MSELDMREELAQFMGWVWVWVEQMSTGKPHRVLKSPKDAKKINKGEGQPPASSDLPIAREHHEHFLPKISDWAFMTSVENQIKEMVTGYGFKAEFMSHNLSHNTGWSAGWWFTKKDATKPFYVDSIKRDTKEAIALAHDEWVPRAEADIAAIRLLPRLKKLGD